MDKEESPHCATHLSPVRRSRWLMSTEVFHPVDKEKLSHCATYLWTIALDYVNKAPRDGGYTVEGKGQNIGCWLVFGRMH